MTWLDDVTMDTIIVHLDGAPSVKGLSAAVHDDCLLMRDAVVLDDASLLGGDLIIPRERVLFIQRINPLSERSR